MVALVCRNNKSTRYAAPLQSLKHQFQLYLLILRQYDEAIAAFKQAPDGLPEVRALIGATYALQGHTSEATPYIESFRSNYNENWIGEPNVETVVGLFSFKRQEDAELLADGLLKAGL